MAEILLIAPPDITDKSILGGNVDVDKYRFCILDTQVRVLEPLLGSTLYQYILTNKDTLTGLYLELFNDFIKPILRFGTIANYLSIASYMVDNGGIYKHTADNKEIVSVNEVTGLVQKYNSLADMYIIRFHKWICENHIPEYASSSDNIVNPDKNLRTKLGWKL